MAIVVAINDAIEVFAATASHDVDGFTDTLARWIALGN